MLEQRLNWLRGVERAKSYNRGKVNIFAGGVSHNAYPWQDAMENKAASQAREVRIFCMAARSNGLARPPRNPYSWKLTKIGSAE